MVPAALGLLGSSGSGVALAPALRLLNGPFLVLTVVVIARGWYLQLPRGQLSHVRGTLWQRRSFWVLAASTVFSAGVWGLRFAGLLGGAPF